MDSHKTIKLSGQKDEQMDIFCSFPVVCSCFLLSPIIAHRCQPLESQKQELHKDIFDKGKEVSITSTKEGYQT